MLKIIDYFRLFEEKEDQKMVIENIHKGVIFRGTNLWILVFAIFVASLGLNVNSTAVIIGAMLISPLMGPIIGVGMGMAINDLPLIRKALFNYGFAAGVSLLTSTVYFMLSPLNEAHSEILARTSPNIYDVLIAFFGGFAGILANTSKQKGNVIPGVAIATALMPPLCSAGYGLATLQFNFFLGAFYLFIINSVFISLATFITIRVLKYPTTHLLDKKSEIKAKRIVYGVVIITLIPSIYFGYDIIQQTRFSKNANTFIEYEASFPNDYLLKTEINPKKKIIKLTFGGELIKESEITVLRSKLKRYDLEDTKLEIIQGFAYLKDNNNQNKEVDEKFNNLNLLLLEKDQKIELLQKTLDSTKNQQSISEKIYHELKVQYPELSSFACQPALSYSDSGKQHTTIALIRMSKRLKSTEQEKIQKWLSVRLNQNNIDALFEVERNN